MKLVDTLQAQHKAGRDLTAQIRKLGATATIKYVSTDSEKLSDALRAFLRMYRPHEAREDTFSFPRSGPFFRPTNTTRSERISRRTKTTYSASKASSRWSIRLRNWRRGWAFTNWRNSPQNNSGAGADCRHRLL